MRPIAPHPSVIRTGCTLNEWQPDKGAFLCTPLQIVPIAGIRRARRSTEQVEADAADSVSQLLQKWANQRTNGPSIIHAAETRR